MDFGGCKKEIFRKGAFRKRTGQGFWGKRKGPARIKKQEKGRFSRLWPLEKRPFFFFICNYMCESYFSPAEGMCSHKPLQEPCLSHSS